MNYRYKLYTLIRTILAQLLGVEAVDSIKLEHHTALHATSVFLHAEGNCPRVAVVSHDARGVPLNSFQLDLIRDGLQAQRELALEEAGGLVGTPEMAFARLKSEHPGVHAACPEEAEVEWNEELNCWTAVSDQFCYYVNSDGVVEGPWDMV